MPHEEHDDIVILTDDEGNEVEFLFLDAFELSGRRYAVLVPLEEAEAETEIEGEAKTGPETKAAQPADEADEEDYVEGSEAMIFRLEKDDKGEDVFVEIEDDDEWAEVTAVWEELQDEELDEDEKGSGPDSEEPPDEDDDRDDEDDKDQGCEDEEKGRGPRVLDR
jgi:uncharacterized protein YrzB (UPF0473 family)